MKRALLCVLVFVLALSCSLYLPSPKSATAYAGWAGAAGIPYVGNANPQSFDVSPNRNWGGGNDVSLDLDLSGNPCIAWDDSGGQICFARWNGSEWVNVVGQTLNPTNGKIVNIANNSSDPSLAIDSGGYPAIAWTNGMWEGIIFARWNGLNWVTASGAVLDPLNGFVANSGYLSGQASLALDSFNNPCIAWTNMTSLDQICYTKWDGSKWVNAAGATDVFKLPSWVAYSPVLCLDKMNVPHIAWTFFCKDCSGDIYYAEWNGANWVNSAGAIFNLGNGYVTNQINFGYSESPSLALDSKGDPHIAWHQMDEIFYAKWNGANWVNTDGFLLNPVNGIVLNTLGESDYPSLALDSNDDPNIAWVEFDSWLRDKGDIFFAKKSKTGWVNALGAPLDSSNGNISENTGLSSNSKLVLDTQGRPNVAFTDDTMGGRRVYYVKWVIDLNGKVELKKNIDSDGDGVFADSGKTVNAGGILRYKIDWSFDKNATEPLVDAYVHDVVPEGTTYVAGSATASMLSHSLDNGATWIAGEPPDGAPAGTRLRWKTPQPGWTTANGQILNPTNPNVSNNTGISDFPSLQLDPSTGYPCIAWSDDVSGTTMVYYAKWDGSQWVNAAGLPFTTANGNAGNIPGGDPTLALDPVNGYPWIAFQSNAILFSNLEIHIVKWNGAQWTNAAGAPVTLLNSNVSNNAGLSWYPSHQLALDSNRNPCFVWKDNTTGSWQSYFARWNGANWVNISGAALNPTNGSLGNGIVDPSFWPTLALDSNDNPYIAWDSNITGNSEICLAKWNGANWVNINGLLLTPTNGNVSNNTGLSLIPYLALDRQTNIPSIVWSDNTPGNYEIYYAKWDGSAWVNSSGATLTATNGNISSNPGNSSLLSMVLDANNLPCVSWEDDTPGNSEIFFARWNGANWTNAIGGNLTASNGLVNSSPGRSWFPSVAVDQLTGNPSIAWLDRTPGNNEVYFAKWTDFGKTFNFSVKISDPFLDYSLSPICNQAEFSHALDSGNHIKSNSVCVSVYKKKSLPEVTKTAARFAYSSTDIVSFIITVANGGKSDILGVNLVDSYPRELEFISSQPQGSKGNGTVRFAIGTLKVGEKRRFELKFKLAKNTVIAEKGIYITNVAKAVSLDSQIESTDQATVLITKDSPLKELVLKVLWAGLNTKTNTAKQGEEISARIMPEGGSSPYEIVVDWGDGQKDKASEITSENYPTFTHTFSSSGEFSIKIICTDQYGKQCVVTRKITVK